MNTNNRIDEFEEVEFSYRIAQGVMFVLWEDYHKLQQIVDKLPDTDDSGNLKRSWDIIPDRDLYCQKSELINVMIKYKSKLSGYCRQARIVLYVLKNSRDKGSTEALKILSAHLKSQDIKEGEGLYELHSKYQTLATKLDNAVKSVDSLIKKASKKKYPRDKQPIGKDPKPVSYARTPMNKHERRPSQTANAERTAAPSCNTSSHKDVNKAGPVKWQALDKCIKELCSVFRILPRVEKDGYSECPSAREIYIKKDGHQAELESYLSQLEREIRILRNQSAELKRHVVVIEDDTEYLTNDSPQERYIQAKQKLDDKRRMIHEEIARLTLKCQDIRRLLAETRNKTWPASG